MEGDEKKTLKCLHSFLFVFLFTMAFHNVFEFTAVVRGFHVLRRIWKPTEGETLTVNDRLSPRGLICQNDFLGCIFKV